MTVVCGNCTHLIQKFDGKRLPPWCPQCGADLQRASDRQAAVPALTPTETKSAAEIAAAFGSREPTQVPQRCEAILVASGPTELPSAQQSDDEPKAIPTLALATPGRVYQHAECGGRTAVSGDDYAALANPDTWVAQTYCCRCQKFVPLETVHWADTNESVAGERQRRGAAISIWRRLLRILFG